MICVDASVAWKWFFEEENTDRARGLLIAALQSQEEMVAPPLLPSEITNIARQAIRRGRLQLDEAQSILRRFLSVPIALRAPNGLHERALDLSVELGLSAAYDAHYLALTEFAGATFWTADDRLFNATAGRLPFVHLLRDYAN